MKKHLILTDLGCPELDVEFHFRDRSIVGFWIPGKTFRLRGQSKPLFVARNKRELVSELTPRMA